ncbi:MAG TPA: hypothetical protein ENN58_00320, partial [bacterium]|nr:hypothetical protein [bacterium]
MPALRSRIEYIGALTIEKWKFFRDFIGFMGRFFKELFGKDIRKEVVLDVIIMQIYFTAVQLLTFFLLISIVIGTVFIGVVLSTLKNMG